MARRRVPNCAKRGRKRGLHPKSMSRSSGLMLRRVGGTSSAERQGSVHVDGTPACGVAAAAADKAAALRSAPVPHPAPRPTIRDGTSHPAPRPTPRDGTSHPAPRQALRDGTSHPASPAVASARGDMTVALRSVRESQAAALAAASARRLALSALHVETLGSSPSGFFLVKGANATPPTQTPLVSKRTIAHPWTARCLCP